MAAAIIIKYFGKLFTKREPLILLAKEAKND